MTNYRYLVTDVLTNTIIAELPLTNVTYGQNLNEAGSLSGNLLLSDSRINTFLGTGSSNPVDVCTTPGQTAIYVDRDGVLVWGGIIWSRSYDSRSQMLEIGAKEFESYFGRRRITSDQVFDEGTDQFTIVHVLVDAIQSAAHGDIGIDTSTIGTCGQGIADVLPILEYEHRNLLDTIIDLSRQGPPYGFDFHIDVAYDGTGSPTRTLRLFYPHKSSPYAANTASYPTLEFPGSIVSYQFPEDGSSMANVVYAFGPGTNEGQYIHTAYGTNIGFPLLEDVITYSQIPDPRIVDQLADAEVEARHVPVTTMSAVWSPQIVPATGAAAGPGLSEFSIGDQFRIRISDSRFPAGVELSRRLSQFDVQVGDNDGAELIRGQFAIVSY